MLPRLISRRARRHGSLRRVKISLARAAALNALSYSPSKISGWIELLRVRAASFSIFSASYSSKAFSWCSTAAALSPEAYRALAFARSPRDNAAAVEHHEKAFELYDALKIEKEA